MSLYHCMHQLLSSLNTKLECSLICHSMAASSSNNNAFLIILHPLHQCDWCLVSSVLNSKLVFKEVERGLKSKLDVEVRILDCTMSCGVSVNRDGWLTLVVVIASYHIFSTTATRERVCIRAVN